MLLMKICVVHPAGLCTECWSPEGSGRALGVMDSDLWLARPWEGGGAWESVPSRAFLATPQSTIPFFYTCWAELLFSLFYVQRPAKGKAQLTSKAVNVHQNTHWDLSVTRAPAFFNYFFFSTPLPKMNSKASLPALPSFACKEGALSSQQTTASVFSAVFKSIACARAVRLVGSWPLVRYARATRAYPQQHWATCRHRLGKGCRDHRVSLEPGAWAW